ncbi:hypothetical protein ACSBR2_041995 [Camellia fascicularis]
MDTINLIKGYGKVSNPSEDQSPPQPLKPTKKPLIAVISLIILLTVIIGAMIGLLIIHESTTESPESSSSISNNNAVESIKAVCSVTQHPNSCFSSISSFDNHSPCRLPKADPELILNLSLRVAVKELTDLKSLPKTLISKSNDARSVSALKDCVSLFDDALSQLNKSVELMDVGPGEKVLTEAKIGDMKTWVSAAMTNQETCLDGLDEMGSTVGDEVRGKVQNSKEYMSNSLAILANIQAVLDKFHLAMH